MFREKDGGGVARPDLPASLPSSTSFPCCFSHKFPFHHPWLSGVGVRLSPQYVRLQGAAGHLPPPSTTNLPLTVGLLDGVTKIASLYLPQAALRRFCPGGGTDSYVGGVNFSVSDYVVAARNIFKNFDEDGAGDVAAIMAPVTSNGLFVNNTFDNTGRAFTRWAGATRQ